MVNAITHTPREIKAGICVLMAIEIINANIHHIFLLFSANTIISSIYEFIPCQ